MTTVLLEKVIPKDAQNFLEYHRLQALSPDQLTELHHKLLELAKENLISTETYCILSQNIFTRLTELFNQKLKEYSNRI